MGAGVGTRPLQVCGGGVQSVGVVGCVCRRGVVDLELGVGLGLRVVESVFRVSSFVWCRGGGRWQGSGAWVRVLE